MTLVYIVYIMREVKNEKLSTFSHHILSVPQLNRNRTLNTNKLRCLQEVLIAISVKHSFTCTCKNRTYLAQNWRSLEFAADQRLQQHFDAQ